MLHDMVRGRPTGRLKSLVKPEIIIMRLQLVSVEKQSTHPWVDTPLFWCVGGFIIRLLLCYCGYPEKGVDHVLCVCVCFLCVLTFQTKYRRRAHNLVINRHSLCFETMSSVTICKSQL